MLSGNLPSHREQNTHNENKFSASPEQQQAALTRTRPSSPSHGCSVGHGWTDGHTHTPLHMLPTSNPVFHFLQPTASITYPAPKVPPPTAQS